MEPRPMVMTTHNMKRKDTKRRLGGRGTKSEPGFGEWKLALGVIGLPVTARDRILRCSPSVVGTTRAGLGLDSFQKEPKSSIKGCWNTSFLGSLAPKVVSVSAHNSAHKADLELRLYIDPLISTA
jgi:hypothetical protein